MSASSSVHLFLRLGIVHILIHDVLHLCWMPRVWGVQKQQKKTRHLKDDLSHILYECFSQHVAGSLTWITTAVSTAPSPSLSFCSSKVPILFPLTLPFKFSQEEKTSLVFLYDLKKKKKKMQSRMTVSLSLYSNLPKRYFKALLAEKKMADTLRRRWGGLFRAPVVTNIAVSTLLFLLLPSLIAIVLSQTNKSKYFFPFLCLWCVDLRRCQRKKEKKTRTDMKQKHIKKDDVCAHFSIYFGHDNLYALSVQYRYNTNRDKHEMGSYIKVKNAPCSKSLIMSLSVKGLIAMSLLISCSLRGILNSFTQPHTLLLSSVRHSFNDYPDFR